MGTGGKNAGSKYQAFNKMDEYLKNTGKTEPDTGKVQYVELQNSSGEEKSEMSKPERTRRTILAAVFSLFFFGISIFCLVTSRFWTALFFGICLVIATCFLPYKKPQPRS
jgi:hypothetical protein